MNGAEPAIRVQGLAKRFGDKTVVVDFAIESGWPFRFFAYEVMALYDVALGKPDR